MWRTKKNPNPEADRCVLCGDETKYSKENPIEDCEGYVVGAGQLCHDCNKNVYLKGPGHHG